MADSNADIGFTIADILNGLGQHERAAMVSADLGSHETCMSAEEGEILASWK